MSQLDQIQSLCVEKMADIREGKFSKRQGLFNQGAFTAYADVSQLIKRLLDAENRCGFVNQRTESRCVLKKGHDGGCTDNAEHVAYVTKGRGAEHQFSYNKDAKRYDCKCGAVIPGRNTAEFKEEWAKHLIAVTKGRQQDEL
jgi:hypothetical protein